MTPGQKNAEDHVLITLLVTKFGLIKETFRLPDPRLKEMIKILGLIELLKYSQKISSSTNRFTKIPQNSFNLLY